MIDTQTIATVVGGVHFGKKNWIRGLSTDSRTLREGDLFVALRGERFDGHAYIEAAKLKGACAAIVDKKVNTELTQVVVKDTEQALGRLSAYWRNQFQLPLVAVTGSCGKTTVKEMIGVMLGTKAKTMVSKGNFNNAIGLPLSLFKLEKQHKFAVVEIGMNQVGEILYLSNLARPTVSVITNAGPAHLQYLNSVEQVAKEKGSIIGGMDEQGTAVLNGDDKYYEYWKQLAGPRKVISYGFSDKVDLTAHYEIGKSSVRLALSTPIGCFDAHINLLGAHNVANALAAAAVGIALGLSERHIIEGLNKVSAVKGRLQIRQHKFGGRLIDDTYNANPASTEAAINFLSKLNGDRRLVVGDMFELGSNDIQFHKEVGQRAKHAGISRLYCLGNLSEFAAKAFGQGASHYRNKRDLLSKLESEIDEYTTVLVKGSRGMKMEEVTDHLCMNGVTPEKVKTC